MADERRTKASSAAMPSPGLQSLGEYLSYARTAKRMTLREVEDATNREVSNAYLSQLEKGAIKRPSPNILYALSEVYGVQYATLMEKAGYIVTSGPGQTKRDPSEKHGSAATFARENLTPEEEEELLKYLAFLRSPARARKK